MLIVVRGLPFTADGRVALARRSEQCTHQPGLFEFPGGKVETDDRSLSKALRREIDEEFGCPCLWISPIPIHHARRTIQDGKYCGSEHVTFAYPVIIDAAHIRLGNEHTGLHMAERLRELPTISDCTPFTHAAAQAMLGTPRRLLTPHARKFI